MQSPSIDIIVPTYNRPDDIKTYINDIVKQDYDNYKVIIIDDCGDSNIEGLIPQNSDNFYFERLSKNSGQAFVRNYAASISNGDIIIFMDDDAYFIETNALSKIARYFTNYKDVGFLMFDILEPNREWFNKRKQLVDRQEIGNFVACGCAFRRTTFNNSNGFSKEFHSYGEETDISMQLIKNSDKLIFAAKVKVFHNYNPGERDKVWLKRFKYNSVRNDLAIVLTRYPLIYVLPFYFGKIFSHFLFTIKTEKHKLLNMYCIIRGAVGSISLFFKLKRDPLTISQFKYWKSRRI